MGKAKLVDQKKYPMTINETGKDSYYFCALYLKGKTMSKDVKVKEDSVEVRTKFCSASRPFGKITMPKSINH